MLRFRRRQVTAAVGALAWSISAGGALACSCAEPIPELTLAQSRYVAEVRVVAVNAAPPQPTITVKALNTFSSSDVPPRIEYEAATANSCHIVPSVGQKWLVFFSKGEKLVLCNAIVSSRPTLQTYRQLFAAFAGLSKPRSSPR